MAGSGGFQQLTVPVGAVSLTVPSGAVCALASLNDVANPLRWRADGTAPTAAIGHIVSDLNPRLIPLKELAVIQFIRTGASDAVLNVTYYTA